MAQADSVLSTPPTNTPVDTTRRRFLTVAAIGSMIGAGTLAAVAVTPSNVVQAVTVPSDSSNHRLRAAIRQLAKAHESLIAAQATNEEAEAMWTDWLAQNPQPASRRGTKRWIRKGAVYHDRVTTPSWQTLIDAETGFVAAQNAVAGTPIAGPADVQAMAACSILYDEVELARHNRAPIARMVALEYFRLGQAVRS